MKKDQNIAFRHPGTFPNLLTIIFYYVANRKILAELIQKIFSRACSG